MEPILSNVAKTLPHNEPRDLLARLYREIGISAVAAALEVSEDAPPAQPSAVERRVALLAARAA